jgi:carboxymethylenebutenolidase
MITVGTDAPFPAYIATPKGEAKGAVIVIHEVWGLVNHIKSIADRLAEQGYIALAPDLLGDSDVDTSSMSELQEGLFDPERKNAIQPQLRALMAPMQNPEFGKNTAHRTKECFDYLYKLPESKQSVAITGFCFGGTYSFTLATQEPRLKLAVPFYGHANFTVDELETITCPVMAFYGENDEALVTQLPELKQKMQDAGVDFTATVYEDCGHAFFNDTNPYAYNEAAATDAWKKLITRLDEAMI